LTDAQMWGMHPIMNYDEFKGAWETALQASGLGLMGGRPTETIEEASLTRHYWTAVEPYGGQDCEPFHVTATIEFNWEALHTARTCTTEGEMLTEIFGREGALERDTEQPWLRVDVKLRASLPFGQEMPMPPASTWRNWAREVTSRLEHIEPLLPEERVETTDNGDLAVLAWQGDPELRVACNPEGALLLDGVTLSGWQAITLPRHWDDPDKSDEPPDVQLTEMFARLRKALGAWMESVDHLRPMKKG